MSFKEELGLEYPPDFDDDILQAVLEENLHLSTRKKAERFKISATIFHNMKELRNVSQSEVCKEVYSYKKNWASFRQNYADDEKCVTCENLIHKRHWHNKSSAFVNSKNVILHNEKKSCACVLLFHSLYSLNHSSTDYHHFCSSKHFLNGKTFNSEKQVKEAVVNFFQSKPVKFYKEEINTLPERCERFVLLLWMTQHNFLYT